MGQIKSKANTNPIIFRKNTSIGSADAEMDDDYLETCFLETEDVFTLLDTSNPQRIVVGRTGSGKTALLKRIEARAEHTIFLSPEDFSFRYLADSTIIKFFEAAGVNLNIFYILLWRHIVCVELIKKKYNISGEDKMRIFMSNLATRISRNEAKRKAFEYLEEWGEKFWETTEIRIKEIAQKFESELAAKLSVESKIINLGAKGVDKLTEEQKLEVINIGKDVVNKIQIKKLTEVINLLDEEIFYDPKDRYYVLIDKLDENWAEDSLRYKIIKSLIETVKKFQKVKNVKVIIALREDLLFRVLRETQDAGFQEEKIEPLYLRLFWNENELEEILNLRVRRLFKRQYNKDDVTIRQILPAEKKYNHQTALSHILSRTFMRPREAILFINFCLEHAAGKTSINYTIISRAEMDYSKKRLQSLCEEWLVDYPLLYMYVYILQGMPSQFIFSDMYKNKRFDDILLNAACRDEQKCNNDYVCKISRPYLDGDHRDSSVVLREMFSVFYQVGLIGVKLAENFPVEWSYRSAPILNSEKFQENTKIYVHPTFYHALGIVTK